MSESAIRSRQFLSAETGCLDAVGVQVDSNTDEEGFVSLISQLSVVFGSGHVAVDASVLRYLDDPEIRKELEERLLLVQTIADNIEGWAKASKLEIVALLSVLDAHQRELGPN